MKIIDNIHRLLGGFGVVYVENSQHRSVGKEGSGAASMAQNELLHRTCYEDFR